MKYIKNEKYLLFFFISLILSMFCFSSCKKQKEEVIVFDDSYPLALSPNVSWALVTDPYAAYKSEMGWNSATAGHCRRGEILQVLGKSVDKESKNWYRFEEGWLPESCLSIYSNRFKALNAANQLKE